MARRTVGINTFLFCALSLSLSLCADPAQETLDTFLRAPDDSLRRLELINTESVGLAAISAFVFTREPIGPDRERIDALGGRLLTGDFAAREAAQSALVAEGELARPALKQLLQGDDPEVSERVRTILKAIDASGYTTNKVRIAKLAALHALLLDDWPMQDLRAACANQFKAFSGVSRFEHPMEREILAVFMASLLTDAGAGADDDALIMRYTSLDGPAAGVAVRVLLGGLSYRFSDALPQRWWNLDLPDRAVVTRPLMKTRNPEVARALVWALDSNDALDAMLQARGDGKSHESPKVAYAYNTALWHFAMDRTAKYYILAVYNDLERGPEGLMHLWARIGRTQKETMLGVVGWKTEPRVERLMRILPGAASDAERSRAEPAAPQELYVWRAAVPGLSTWYQTTELLPLAGQAMPLPSAARDRAESDYFGVVHFSGLAPGPYRVCVQSGTTFMSKDVDLQDGLHAIFLPPPTCHSSPIRRGISTHGFAPRHDLTIGLGSEFVGPRAVRLSCTEEEQGITVETTFRYAGDSPLFNFGKGLYRIEAHAQSSGQGAMDLGPGELRIPLPMPIDVALNAPLRHVRGDILQAVADDPESMIVFRSHVSILKGKGFVFTQESVEGSSPIRVRFPLGSDGRFEARLVEGPWVAEWASDQGIPHTQAFRVTAAEGPQTLTLGRP